MFDMRPYRNNNDRRNNLSAYNPFREMDAFERNFFNDPFGSWFDHSALASFKTDIKDNGDSYTLEADRARALTRRTSISIVNGDHADHSRRAQGRRRKKRTTRTTTSAASAPLARTAVSLT